MAVLWLAPVALALAGSPVPTEAAEPDESETEPIPSAEPGASPLEPSEEPARSGPEPAGIEVMTVRGGKGLGDLSTDVPTSLVQFGQKELEALGAQDISDLARVTPSLEINTLTASSPTFFIRGVGLSDFSANAAGAVAIYNDGVPLNAPALQAGQLFDVEEVAVLRGPQGYDDNRNASAGAIRTTSRLPTGNYEARLRADYGNYDMRDAEGVLSLPIVTNWLSVRGAFRYYDRDPLVKNRCGALSDAPAPQFQGSVCNETADSNTVKNVVPPGLPTRVNNNHRWGARGILRLEPPESETNWLLNVHSGEIDEDSPLGQIIGTTGTGGTSGGPTNTIGYQDPDWVGLFLSTKEEVRAATGATGGRLNEQARFETNKKLARHIELADPFTNDYNLVGKEHLRTLGTSFTGEFPLFSLDSIRAKTISGWDRYRRNRLADFDYTSNTTTHLDTEDEAWQVNQNLGFEWEPSLFPGAVRWGGYYLHEKLQSDASYDLQLIGLIPLRTLQEYEQETDSFGTYGNFTWDFLDDFQLNGGVRFNWESKAFDMTARAASNDTTPSPASLDKTWSAPTGGIGLTYFFSNDVTAYLKYTRGWKAGHIQGNSLRSRRSPTGDPVTATPTVAEPESIDAFELGTRGQWFDNRLELGTSFFYYSYADYQVFVIESQFGSAPVLKIINANDARVYGAEADFRIDPLRGWVARAIDGLSLSGRFGWLESEFLDFTDTRSAVFGGVMADPVVAQTVVDYTGNRLPNTPRFKFSGTADYYFDLERWGTPGVRYDITWTDDIFFDPSEGLGVTGNPFLNLPNLPDYAIGQHAYRLQDLRVYYRLPSGKIEVAIWCHNLTNEIYKTYVSDTTAAFNSLQNLVGDPRTYGGSISFIF